MVLFQCLGEDQDVVQVYYHNTFCYKVLKDVVHYSLESGEVVCYTKEYHQRFEKTMFMWKAAFHSLPGLIQTLLKS